MIDGHGLWPPPQKAQCHEQALELPLKAQFFTPLLQDLQVACERLVETWRTCCFGELSIHANASGSELGRFIIDPNWDTHDEGYRLQADSQGIVITAGQVKGLFYGVITLCQWLEYHHIHQGVKLTTLPGLRVTDWPDIQHRGFMMDISRSKVPTMASLFELVDLAASFKINQIQLYMEHSFAYRGHETVWRNVSPMTGEEIRILDRYCRARFIELVPNQNSFGHFHQWLKHEKYRDLAECPDGIKHPFSLDLEPFSLCPTDPRNFDLLADLYQQLLPNFTSKLFNVGLDETFDLGQGRSAALCEEKGKTAVYLAFLNRVHRSIRGHGRRMQFWGDIIIQQPDSLSQLPEDVIALEWGYEADHPFMKHAEQFADSGREFYVCPGTSSWSSVTGRIDNALANLASAAKAAHQFGASGYLICDWGDYGHFQPPSISWPAWLAGAGWAWHVQSANPDDPEPLKQALSTYLFKTQDSGAVQAIWEMGLAYRDCGIQPSNGSSLFFLLLYADQTLAHPRLAGLNKAGLSRSQQRLSQANELLNQATMNREDADLIRAELRWASDLLQFACRLGKARLDHDAHQTLAVLPASTKNDLSQLLETLGHTFKELRQKRFRPGGTQISLRYLQRIQALLAHH